jgi:hypothetical protein
MTLADVRTLIEKHLPAHFRDNRSWRHVAAELDKAAAGGMLAMLRSPCGLRCR